MSEREFSLEKPLTRVLDEEELDALEHAIRAYMKEKNDQYLNHKNKARLKFLVMILMACVNVSYTCRHAYRMDDAHWIPKWSSRIEAVVVLFTFAASVSSVVILFTGKSLYHVRSAVHMLDVTGSFSLLWFLPLPAKILYWLNHKEIYWRRYIKNPPDTSLNWLPDKPQFDPRNSEHWQALRKISSILKNIPSCLVKPPVCLAWFVSRVVFPVACILFVPFSPFAAVVKMRALHLKAEGHTDILQWEWDQWLGLFGFLNQMSRMWSPQDIAMDGLIRHIDGIHRAVDKDHLHIVTGLRFHRALWKVISHTFEASKLDALYFMTVLDVETIGQCLGKAGLHIGDFHADKDDKVPKSS